MINAFRFFRNYFFSFSDINDNKIFASSISPFDSHLVLRCSMFEHLVLTEARCWVVKVCKDAIFASENALIARHGWFMIDVSVYRRGPAKIINLSDALNSLKLLVHSVSKGHGCRVLVLLKGDNVVTNTIEVVIGSDCWSLRWPRVSCSHVLLVLRPLDHPIEQVLEGPFSIWRLRTDMICGAPRETHCPIADTFSIELSVSVKS